MHYRSWLPVLAVASLQHNITLANARVIEKSRGTEPVDKEPAHVSPGLPLPPTIRPLSLGDKDERAIKNSYPPQQEQRSRRGQIRENNVKFRKPR